MIRSGSLFMIKGVVAIDVAAPPTDRRKSGPDGRIFSIHDVISGGSLNSGDSN